MWYVTPTTGTVFVVVDTDGTVVVVVIGGFQPVAVIAVSSFW